ncbi:HEAT repeat domain-containing protein [Methanobacterium sp. SMA-27]|uniref:HEAT repeat domain-containing protein n=1 Tax=Methanobacterium sp. SMA-27 TaxID=1495336 RepID=UPI00064F1C86|nr:HEAT repeat domain-containing protein [Methanobacterium sp. SMA-27]
MGYKFNKLDIEKLRAKNDIKGLIKTLKHEDSNIRMFAAISLGEIGDKKAIVPLIQSLKDEEECVRNEVLNSLVKIGDPAVDNLIVALKDEKLEEGVKFALIKIGEPSSRNLMFKYNNQNRDTKIYYINLMGEIGDKNSIEHLIHILKDIKSNEKYDREILISTIKSLGKIGDERARDIIHDLYFRFCRSQSDRYLTELFMDVIINVDRNGSDFLVQELSSNDCKVREEVADALIKMEYQMAVDPLILALTDNNGDIFRKRASEILSRIGKPAVIPLIQALRDEDRYLRCGAADSLGKIGDERAVNPLINALKDKDSYIRLEAAKALDKIGWKSRGGQENVYYLIAKTKWIEVSKIGKLAVFPLIQTLKYGELDLRFNAAETLGEIGDERALEPLKQTLKDEDEDVRKKVSEVLVNMGWNSKTDMISIS